MSQYFLNIAARNTGSKPDDLLPSAFPFSAAATGINEGFIDGNDTQENSIQKLSVQQGIVSAQSLMPQKAQQPAVLNETEISLTEKNTGTSYFIKHIERVTAEKENSPIKNKGDNQNVHENNFVNKTVSIIDPEKKITKKQVSEEAIKKTATIRLNEPVEADEIIFSEKQIIQPADITTEVQHKKINLSDNLRIERITPNQQDQVNKKNMQNSKEYETVPKLVIGKITVEILPPKLPAPQKTITKFVQSPSQSSHSKSNKLIFGLGQL